MEKGPRLQVSSDRLMKPGIEFATPGLPGKRFIHYITGPPTYPVSCSSFMVTTVRTCTAFPSILHSFPVVNGYYRGNVVVILTEPTTRLPGFRNTVNTVLTIKIPTHTAVPTKSDSDVIFCLRLLRKTLAYTLLLRQCKSIDHLCINPILRIGLIHK